MAQSTAHPVKILPTISNDGVILFPVEINGIVIFRHPTHQNALNCPELYLPDVIHDPYVNAKNTITYHFAPASGFIVVYTKKNSDQDDNPIQQHFRIENGLIKNYMRKQDRNGNYETYLRKYSGYYPVIEFKVQKFQDHEPETRDYTSEIFYIMASVDDKLDISLDEFILTTNRCLAQQPNLNRLTYPHYQYKSIKCRSNCVMYMHRFEKYYVREDKTIRIGLIVYFCGANPDNMITYYVKSQNVFANGQKITDPDIIKVVQENVM